ncbi:hypothetical protein KI387_004231, partial [Taxus chinensis]
SSTGTPRKAVALPFLFATLLKSRAPLEIQEDSFFEFMYTDRDTVRVEFFFMIGTKIPVQVLMNSRTDQKVFSLAMKNETSLKLGEGKSILGGLHINIADGEYSYILSSGTMFHSSETNKTTTGAGISVMGNAIVASLKLEETLKIGRKFEVVVSSGGVTTGRDVAYGGTLKAYPLREKGRSRFPTLRLLIMEKRVSQSWCVHDIRCTLYHKFKIDQSTKLWAMATFNSRGTGNIDFHTATSQHLQLALVIITPKAFHYGLRLLPSDRDTTTSNRTIA